jgi:protoporphyrin/coproporphyrin ferrochelatase
VAGVTPARERPIGVLCMAYGTAAGPEDVERYYTDIRGGRAPSPEHLAELKSRYRAIGNRFPLLDITRRQAGGLERALNVGDTGTPGFRTYLGMKHSAPFVAEGVDQMERDGIERAVGLVLAPHWATMSVESYVERVDKAVADLGRGPSFTFVRSWYDHPNFVRFLAGRVGDALAKLPTNARDDAAVIFSAHSLPTREHDGERRCKLCFAPACAARCEYVHQLGETARLVADAAGIHPGRVAIGWQSAGRTPDPWWGPPVEDVIRELAAAGRSAVVVCSAGFVADHLEILYDLDIEARQVADDAGIAFVRTEMPNADPAFVRVLAQVVRDHLAEQGVRA